MHRLSRQSINAQPSQSGLRLLADIQRQSTMKLKFMLLTCLLIFSRACDFYSTSLWFFQPGGMESERNPLTYFLGVGWSGLIIANVIVVGAIIGMFYYYCFRYKRPIATPYKARNYWELASLHYFGRPDCYYQLFYKIPKNKHVLFAHLGYVGTIGCIAGSFIATFHNLSQFYGFPFYDRFREIVGRPLFVIYGLMILIAILLHRNLLKQEYRRYIDIS
jgi:hypothetical protein